MSKTNIYWTDDGAANTYITVLIIILPIPKL